MKISSEKLLEVIEALQNEEYTVTELATDYGGCYRYITQPDGTKGYVPVYDDAKYGTSAPVRRGVVNVCGLKFFYADAGTEDYEPDILWVDEDPDYDESYESVAGCCNLELENDMDADAISTRLEELDIYEDTEDLVEIFLNIMKDKFCYFDTWDEVPDDCLGDDAVDIEDCTLIQDAGLGSFDIEGVRYHIVSTEVEKNDEREDNGVTYVYAVPETIKPNEYGCYDGVYLIGYRGELDSPEIVCLKEKDRLLYNSVYVCVE